MHTGTAILLALALAPAGDHNETWVRERAKEVRESDTDAWRKIPWADSLLDASKQAKDEGRLMFVFSHEGNIDTGRC